MQFFLARARYSELSENNPGTKKFNRQQAIQNTENRSTLSEARSIKKTIP